MERIRVIDSHTEGEPTRVVIEGGPDLGTGPMAERRDRMRAAFRTAGPEAVSGFRQVLEAMMDPDQTAFFNALSGKED